MNEDWSQRLDTEAFRQAGGSTECVDEHQLAAYAERVASAANIQEIEQHLADCSRCSRIVAFLHQDRGQEAVIPDHVLARAKRLPKAHRPARTSNWRWVAAAAVIVVVVAATWSRWPALENRDARQEGQPTETRLAPAETIHEPEFLWPTDGLELPADALTARWSAVPHALFYGVRLLTVSGDLVFEQRVDSTELTLPSSIRLKPGERYFMRVEAFLAEGQSLASRHVTFTVEETP